MEKLTMKNVREVLRLKLDCNLSARKIAQTCGFARSTIGEYISRFNQSGLDWPLPPHLSDGQLAKALFKEPADSQDKGTMARPEPDWQAVYNELRTKGVTLQLLWQEYKLAYPDGYQYAWFCENYTRWHGKRDLVMRQHHLAGEKLFVDFSGTTIPIVDRRTGDISKAEVFVAVMGASNYTFVMALNSQKIDDWILGHVKAFEFLGGCPEIVVPDNLKSGVTKACRYEPQIQSTYAEMASHYGIAIIPTRVRKPKDKAKVEGGVLLVLRWIIAKLRNETFFTLHGANEAIKPLVAALNARPFRKMEGSRLTLFQAIDLPALRPLPETPYEFAQWKTAKVHPDYHVEVEAHYYSVPYTLVGQKLDIRWTLSTVEIFHQNIRVASHLRGILNRRHTTLPEHMPASHQYAEFSPERLLRWAQKYGPATAAMLEKVMQRRQHVQQSYRCAMGILRLSDVYGGDRLEAACRRALLIGTYRYGSIESILKKGLDQQELEPTQDKTLPLHGNVRGPEFFQ